MPDLTGQIEYFTSRVDGGEWPCAVCATDSGTEPKALLIQVNPGGYSNLDWSLKEAEELAETALRRGHSCIVLRATGRGDGTVYQNYGEVDVFEAIDHVMANYPIDPARISLIGHSMGGAAVWYLVSHYPDRFAAGAPLAGYCDYRLWERPGGTTFHMAPWEEPSWQGRSAAMLAENFQHTPMWILHGQRDRAVGGGVAVEHARQMARRLDALGYPCIYTEVAARGHDTCSEEQREDVVDWLLQQRKTAAPDSIVHATWTLRHNRSYWLAIDTINRHGERALAQAAFDDDDRLIVETENVGGLTLGPLPRTGNVAVTVNGADRGEFPAGQPFTVSCVGGEEKPATGGKVHTCSGPIGDMFHQRTILVTGTTGTKEESFFNQWCADDAVEFFKGGNGGVHRGGIPGRTEVSLPVIKDRDLTDDELRDSNLILYGNFGSNSVAARYRDRIGVDFEAEALVLGGRRYDGEACAVFAVFPHPDNPSRYVAVHGGISPDAITWGAHLNMMLLPDYIVYNKGDLLDWGFFDTGWQ